MTVAPAGKVVAVIVSYNGEEQLTATLAAIRPQVDDVVIVDNGSAEASQRTLRRIEHQGSANVLYLGDNHGIAAAQNAGIARAAERGAEWVLLLDQDSECAPGLVAALLRAATTVPRAELGFCCPSVRPCGSAAPEPLAVQEITHAIASGCLHPMSTLRAVGGMREDYFIDSVDFEYCLRLRAKGYRSFRANDAHLSHRLGTRREVKLGPMRLELAVHPALRRYYMFRNHVLLAREYWRTAPRFLGKKTIFMLLALLQVITLERDRARTLRYCWAGLRDGLAGRTGRKS